MLTHLTLATRQSPLALWQTHQVQHALQLAHPQLKVDILGLTTTGDKRLDVPLQAIGGKGLFMKELEQALLSGEADLAVHSMKDVPAVLPAGFGVESVLERGDPRDCLVGSDACSIQALPPRAKVGTSSLRRQAHLLALRPDLRIQAVRGNIATRLQQLASPQLDALLLAQCALTRLGIQDVPQVALSPTELLPAIGQGAIGIEYQTCRQELVPLIRAIQHPPTEHCLVAERTVNAILEGDCSSSIAALATVQQDRLQLEGRVLHPSGTPCLHAVQAGPIHDGPSMAERVAQELLTQGAKAILASPAHNNDENNLV